VAFNAGLWYDKFPDRWTGLHDAAALEFDKRTWIDSMASSASTAWDAGVVAEAVRRQGDMAHALGGIVLRLRNTSRFVTGLGRTHPVESGFTWHHTLGVPYLPGTGLKGVLRDWARTQGAGDQRSWFGDRDHVGEVVFLDLLPVEPPTLCCDVMTPHYGRYYQTTVSRPAPGDWFDPTPIPFLVVESGQSWQCSLVPPIGRSAWVEDTHRELRHHVSQALSWLGAGAKTAVGYGRFEVDENATCAIEAERAAVLAEAEERARLEQETARFGPLAFEFYQQRREEAWDVSKDVFAQSAMYGGWLERLEREPNPAVLEMMRELLEKHFPGLLTDPDQTHGKKNVPVFKDRQRDFARRFNLLGK